MDDFQIPHLIDPYRTFRDKRGSFKVLERPVVRDKTGNCVDFSSYQENVSVSRPGVLRGMHWQMQFPQAKLVKVICGSVVDVVVDIRPRSPTFGQVFSFNLTEENGRQLFVPRGFAHGFYNYGPDDAVFHYCVDNVYYPSGERGLLWKSIDFDWPIPRGDGPVVSTKDSLWPGINDIPAGDFEDLC